MTNNKSIHDIIHDKYSRILKGYEDKIAKREKFKICLKNSNIDCLYYRGVFYLIEKFLDSKKAIEILYYENGKIASFKKATGNHNEEIFCFDENGKLTLVMIFNDGEFYRQISDEPSLGNMKLDEWFLRTCEPTSFSLANLVGIKLPNQLEPASLDLSGLTNLGGIVEMEEGVRTIMSFLKGKQHTLNMDGLYDFLFKNCIEELDLIYPIFDGINDAHFIENGYESTYKVENGRFITRKERGYRDIYTLIHFDKAGFIKRYECLWDSNSNDNAHGYIAFFEDGKIVRLQHVSDNEYRMSESFGVPIIKNVKAEYDVLKNKLVEAYQESKRIELEIKKLHEAKDENSELKKSIAKEIEELRSKCNHKFEYYGCDSHRDYECCIFCELTR